jgi:acyl dehydratase
MIRHWVEAMGDENPVYTDDEAARANGFPGVIAPPTMLQSWIMRGYKATAALAEARAAGRRSEGASPADDLMHVLDEGGFTSVVATNCEQEYHRPLVLGDRLSVASSIESVSPEKHTGPRDRPLRHHPPDLHRPVGEPRWPHALPDPQVPAGHGQGTAS